MKITIKLNYSALKKLTEGAKLALGATTEALKTEVEQAQVVPRDLGDLQDSMAVDKARIRAGKTKLTFNTVYARRLYFHPEYNFRKTENPNAKGKWLEDWLPGGKDEQFVHKAFAKFYKQFAGGVVK